MVDEDLAGRIEEARSAGIAGHEQSAELEQARDGVRAQLLAARERLRKLGRYPEFDETLAAAMAQTDSAFDVPTGAEE